MKKYDGIIKGVDAILNTDWPEALAPGGHGPFRRPPLEALVRCIEANLDPSRGIGYSGENWRFEPQTNISSVNTSSEVILERAFAVHLADTGRWANQVPTASGCSTGRDGKRSIDLVQDLENGRLKFVELKTGSNDACYAAVEILLYGLIYLVTRRHYARPGIPLPSRSERLLSAKSVCLVVLAPEHYYAHGTQSAFRELESAIDSSLRDFSTNLGLGVTLSFRFEILGPGFDKAKGSYERAEIEAMAIGIRPLFTRD